MMTFGDRKRLMISLFVLLLLCVGVGYAALTSNLSIAGNTEIASNTWDIHFDNLNVTAGSVAATVPAAINPLNNREITYTVKLNRPKDFYEFTVDVVNAGTLPGKVSISAVSGITAEAEEVVDYSVTYTNDNPVNVGDIISTGLTKSIKVRVFYKDDIDEEDLPTSNLNLTLIFTLQYVQSEKDEFIIRDLIQQLKTENNLCFVKYSGQVTDRVGQTVTADNVYFDQCLDKRNIIFGGFCWQVVRTTETGGMKIIYNGEPVDGKCESTRGDHKGIIDLPGAQDITNLASEYLYGSSFTYNTTTNEFTLADTELATWSDLTYEDLIGKFTCKNTNGICTTLYSVNSYSNSTDAYISQYMIGDVYYAQIGKIPYNSNTESSAMVGYMFNKVYNYAGNSAPTNGSLKGNDVSYYNGIYTLLPAAGENTLGTSLDDTHHYTCNTTSSTCTKVRYYYYNNYYVELDGAANIEAVVSEMLYDNNVNRYNSSMKGVIEAWYAQNLASKTNRLEDTVYCYARNMTNSSTNGWNKNGSLTTEIRFKGYSITNDLSCSNVTDQFAVSNNIAKLKYPVALATHEELYTLTNNGSLYSALTETGFWWWSFSPVLFDFRPLIRIVDSDGFIGDEDGSGCMDSAFGGTRPVVTLSSSAIVASGTGTETNPWIVD